MVHEWRHLKMAKWSGCGHDPDGILKTPPGGFTILCCACPEPSINLPLDWQSAPVKWAWIYTYILNKDANFQLKNWLQSSLEQDPPLGPGYVYFVEGQVYANHLQNYINQEEIHSHPNLLLWNSHLTTIFHFVLVCYCLALWTIL